MQQRSDQGPQHRGERHRRTRSASQRHARRMHGASATSRSSGIMPARLEPAVAQGMSLGEGRTRDRRIDQGAACGCSERV